MFNKDKMVYVDVDTINAFMKKGGTLYKPETETIKNNLGIITKLAEKYEIKILSLQDRHYGDSQHAMAESELKINGGLFDLHADLESGEMYKIQETVLPLSCVTFPTDLQIQDTVLFDIVNENNQLIFEKQSISAFYSNQNLGGNPILTRVLDKIQPTDVFMGGVYTEYCIQENALGFRLRNCNVWIIRDAITSFYPVDGTQAIKDLSQMGCCFITTEAFRNLLRNNFGN